MEAVLGDKLWGLDSLLESVSELNWQKWYQKKRHCFHTNVKYTKNNTVFILNTFLPEVTHFHTYDTERRGTTHNKTNSDPEFHKPSLPI